MVSATSNRRKWSIKEIRDTVQCRFGKRPCWWQVKAAVAIWEGKDVVACAATGAGKTLTFWIPLLMAQADGIEDAVVVVITPLNLLGKQNTNSLAQANISAIGVSRDNATDKTFKVSESLIPISNLTMAETIRDGHSTRYRGVGLN